MGALLLGFVRQGLDDDGSGTCVPCRTIVVSALWSGVVMILRGVIATVLILASVGLALMLTPATAPVAGEAAKDAGPQLPAPAPAGRGADGAGSVLVQPASDSAYLSARAGRNLTTIQAVWQPAVVDAIKALAVATDSRALLLLRGDGVVVDYSPEGRGPFPVASISKAISALAVARLVDEGRVTFDDHVADTLVSWRDDGRAKIRIRDLLSHTSGLSDDNAVAVEPPGGLPRYHLAAYNVVPSIVTAKSGMPFHEFVDTHLLRPAGGQSITWLRDEHDVAIAGHGARITIDDLAVIGRLILHGGFADGGEVLRARTLDEMTRAHGKIARGFGLGLFMHHAHDNALQWDIVEARGATGHMVTVVPGKQAVLVRIGSGGSDTGVAERYHALLRQL